MITDEKMDELLGVFYAARDREGGSTSDGIRAVVEHLAATGPTDEELAQVLRSTYLRVKNVSLQWDKTDEISRNEWRDVARAARLALAGTAPAVAPMAFSCSEGDIRREWERRTEFPREDWCQWIMPYLLRRLQPQPAVVPAVNPAVVPTAEPTDAQVEALARELHRAAYAYQGGPQKWADNCCQDIYRAEARAAFAHIGTPPASRAWKVSELPKIYYAATGNPWAAILEVLDIPIAPEEPTREVNGKFTAAQLRAMADELERAEQ